MLIPLPSVALFTAIHLTIRRQAMLDIHSSQLYRRPVTTANSLSPRPCPLILPGTCLRVLIGTWSQPNQPRWHLMLFRKSCLTVLLTTPILTTLRAWSALLPISGWSKSLESATPTIISMATTLLCTQFRRRMSLSTLTLPRRTFLRLMLPNWIMAMAMATTDASIRHCTLKVEGVGNLTRSTIGVDGEKCCGRGRMDLCP